MNNKKIIIFLALLISILVIFYTFYEMKYADCVYPGTYIGEVNIGGKTLLEAEKLINERLGRINQEGIKFIYAEEEIIIYPITSSLDAELLNILISFDVDSTLNKAILIGRNDRLMVNILNRIKPFWGEKNYVTLNVTVNEKKVHSNLKEKLSVFDPQDAYYYFNNYNELSIKPGEDGKKINYEKALFELKNNLEKFDSSNISIEAIDSSPEISEKDCLNIEDKVNSSLELAPIKLKYLKKEWVVSQKDLLGMMVFSKEDDVLIMNLNDDKIKEYIEINIAPEINQRSMLPKFSFKYGVIKNFEPGQEGRIIDSDLFIELFKKGILKEIELAVDVLPFPKNVTEDVNDLGIREIVGKYSLGFEGSTEDRTLNIKNGSRSINGLLIAPGEEFSMLGSLGTIDGENGYQKEAVIIGDAIHYGFGGGLCHISTTLFRAVLESGLPVTMRQNHSYNMPYYQPAGTDATIYVPSPDFRFVNDMENYILIQSEVVGQELYIELWGAKDGRIIEKTEPVVYNIVKPLPTKYTRTYSLSSGKVECTYVPYNGADVYFDYTITYPDGIIKEKRFKSHYIPRRGSCLVGI